MNIKVFVTLLALVVLSSVDGKRSLSGRGGSSSARGTSRRTNYNPKPAPTSLSYPQASAPKPSLSGWQEKTGSKQSNPQNTHSYPSSQTGLSGNKQAKSPSTNQESVQRTSATQNLNTHQQPNSQSGHSYPASNGLSGSDGNGNSQPTGSRQQSSGYPQQAISGTSHQQGSGYPQQTASGTSHQQGSSYPHQAGGLSGSGAPPPYSGAAAPPPYSGYKPSPYNGASSQSNNYGYQHPQPPPSYSSHGYGGYGGHPTYHPSNVPQSPGYFGNYASGNRGGMSRSGSALTGVGIAGAGVGTLLTGLALWNLARSTGNRHHTVIYDNRGQPVAVAPDSNNASETNSMLTDLVNCSLTISNDEKTEVLAIPCAIATSFTPDADVKASENSKNATDNTKCTVTVIHKTGKEYMTTIPCSILLNTAAENNVTEPPLNVTDNVDINGNQNGTMIIPPLTPILDPNQPQTPILDPNQPQTPILDPNQPLAPILAPNQPPSLSLMSTDNDQSNTTMNLNCTAQPGEIRDPINPCYSITHNLTVIPLETTEIEEKQVR